MSASQQQRNVLLVGSVPLANEEEVFTTASAILGDRLRRIPDGETGIRINWIGWQMGVMEANPSLEQVSENDREYGQPVRYKLREGVSPEELTFINLGYAQAAKSSYATFRKLKEEGTIPAGVRFEVSLPTPLASIVAYVDFGSQAIVERAYEKRLLEEMAEICAGIPHDQLAIQWDIAVEFAVLEGVWQVAFDNPEQGIIERLVRISRQVPDDVELGYHLCYGDYDHQHFVEPKDTSRLVTIANAVSEQVKRDINWVHLPVPRDRSDDAYFAPLANLKLHPETELYLGLVHYTDGLEGTNKRIEAASKAVSDFGLATECGLGRRPPETIPALLEIHAQAAGS